ncbi:MAG TPA: DEAD/DEAH box helicase [Pyrinomonadaceae bacterium]|nr:DEAD/DEAH box helicase [Pyrinomonadaceae bacterium]
MTVAHDFSVTPFERVILRDYQSDMIDRLRQSLRSGHRRVLLQSPTGSGKTALAAFITKESSSRGKSVYFNCHRAELVSGTSNTFSKYGIRHGFIVAGREGVHALVNVCSIDTLKNRLATTPPPYIAIWDECKHLGAAGWKMILDAWPDTIHIGLDATPWRLDGTGLDDCFDDLILGPAVSWLIEHGHLSQYEIFAPFTPNMKGARKQAGDWSKKDASDRMDIPKRTGDIVKHWRLHASGLRTIGFAVNVADSLMLVDRFNAEGIPAAHLDAKTPKGLRKQIIDKFARGEILVLFNVALFDEGFDLAAIAQADVTVDCLIDAAPTMSLSRVLQRWGRVLRPKPYPAIILDHAGNSSRHGFPDDEREWSLQGRDKSGGAANDNGPPPPVTCTGCFRQIKRPLPDCCPSCGKKLIAEMKPVEVTEGELKKLTAEDKAAQRRKLRQEEHEAKTLAELAALGQRRGYANPTTWAFKKWRNSPTRQRLAKFAG